ncbi:MAG TPA: ABC transporter substrate-binding protein [Mycobacteriales bacterium]|nr:ABC transporter substrate-binding protein [Mycobacteriales bacterium]
MTKAPLRLAALGAVAALGLAACGGSSSGGGNPTSGGSSGTNTASAPGVTATTVTIGSHQPLTGVAAPGYDEIAPAANAYFQYVNANGGINGRTIKYTYLDDAYDPTKTVADVHKLVEQDKVFAIFNGLGTPTHEAVVPFLNQQKVPDLFVASGCLCWNNPSSDPETFGWQPDYTREGKILGSYIKQHFAGDKVAIFAQGDDFGHNGVKGLEDEVASSDVATVQYYNPTNTTVTPLVQNIAQSGAQVVVSFSVPAFTALYQLTAAQLKFQPKALVVSNVGSDPITLSGLLTQFSKGAVQGKDLIQGIITDGYLASPSDPSNSWIQLFKKIHDTYIPKLPFDGNVEYGMAAAYTFAQALEAAGQNPTRESLVQAVEKGGFTGPGLVPFGYSASDHSGYIGTQIGIIKGLAISPVGTPETTDDGSGPITPYTTAQPTAPANGIPTD